MKKQINKWLHRLPVLLTALLILVSSFTMAVPSHASSEVLGGDQPYSFTVTAHSQTVTITLPRFYPYVLYVPELYDMSSSKCLIFVSDSYFNIYELDGFLYAADGSLPLYVTTGSRVQPGSDPTITDVVIEQDDLTPVVEYEMDVKSPDFVISSSLRGYTINQSFEMRWYDLQPPSKVGILNVFSGVSSWLSGAVQNISTMFWTAGSGMTVFGYLAVASLALAVILLVFYLIAGWLKFH